MALSFDVLHCLCENELQGHVKIHPSTLGSDSLIMHDAWNLGGYNTQQACWLSQDSRFILTNWSNYQSVHGLDMTWRFKVMSTTKRNVVSFWQLWGCQWLLTHFCHHLLPHHYLVESRHSRRLHLHCSCLHLVQIDCLDFLVQIPWHTALHTLQSNEDLVSMTATTNEQSIGLAQLVSRDLQVLIARSRLMWHILLSIGIICK